MQSSCARVHGALTKGLALQAKGTRFQHACHPFTCIASYLATWAGCLGGICGHVGLFYTWQSSTCQVLYGRLILFLKIKK